MEHLLEYDEYLNEARQMPFLSIMIVPKAGVYNVPAMLRQKTIRILLNQDIKSVYDYNITPENKQIVLDFISKLYKLSPVASKNKERWKIFNEFENHFRVGYEHVIDKTEIKLVKKVMSKNLKNKKFNLKPKSKTL